MKQVVEKKKIERVGVEDEQEFTIKAGAHAFKILSDGLYSDKPKAILRELSCNAYDAHVAAGNLKKPFEVQIPNSLDPKFRIRDFGTGLSPQEMEKVYKTYFESTKTDTNDQIGCLGLGSKTPFSYTDSFTTTTFYNGMRYDYNAHINEAGIPALALLGEEKTKEPNGLEISFSVKKSDFRSFEYKVEEVFKYFKKMPTIKGTNVQPEPLEYTMKHDTWGVREDDKWGPTMAVMGNVAYPINNMNVEGMRDNERKLLSDCGLDLFFEIGDLDVQPSREGLQFNKRTTKHIRTRLAEIEKTVLKDAKKQIKDCTTLWDARIKATELNIGEYSTFRFLYEGQDVFEYDGQSLTTTGQLRVSDKKSGLLEDAYEILHFYAKQSWRANSGITVKKSTTDVVKAAEGTRLYLNDIKKGQHIRAKQEAIQDDVSDVFLINADAKTLKMIKARLGVKDIPSIGDIEVIKDDTNGKRAVRGAYNPKNAKKILEYNTEVTGSHYSKNNIYWNTTDVDLNDGGVYVEIERYKVTSGSNRHGDAGEVYHYYKNILKSIGLEFDFPLYGIKPSMMEKEDILSKPEWVTLDKYVQNKVEEHMSDADNKETVVKWIAWKNFKNATYNSRARSLIAQIKDEGIKGDAVLNDFVAIMAEMESDIQDKNTLESVSRQMRIEVSPTAKENKGVDVPEFQKMFDAVCKRYTLLDHLTGRLDKATLKEYVDMVDLVK
jgi:hypothetical protein